MIGPPHLKGGINHIEGNMPLAPRRGRVFMCLRNCEPVT